MPKVKIINQDTEDRRQDTEVRKKRKEKLGISIQETEYKNTEERRQEKRRRKEKQDIQFDPFDWFYWLDQVVFDSTTQRQHQGQRLKDKG